VGDRLRVFLTYSLDDREFAERLRAAMTDENVEVWDPVSVTAGEKFQDSIEDALKQADVVVYVIPEREGSGKWSLFELGAAKALGKRIVAVLPDTGRIANSAVAARLADRLVVDENAKSPSGTVRKILEKAA
jgi:nucleoside 2-deoxyribosyltransferase